MSFFLNILDIVSIPGVDRYMLLEKGGAIISHNLESPDRLFDFANKAGNGCFKTNDLEQFGPFRFVIVKQDGGNSIVLFRLNKYSLCVVSDTSVTDHVLVNNVRQFISTISSS